MVSSISIAFMIVTLAICLLMPVILAIYFYRRYKISIAAIFIGAGVFAVFQLAIRIPLLNVFAGQQWYLNMSHNIYLVALFLGLTAGLFEEVGRYIAMKLFMKKSLSWKNGIAFGIGHGGIEAITIVGITILNYIVISILINTGTYDTMIAASLPAGVAEQVKEVLVSTQSVEFLAGGIERFMTMFIQIAFSVMVLYSVKFKKPIYLLYAILLHALVDTPLAILNSMGWNIWILEAIIAVMAATAVVYIVKAKAIFEKQEKLESAD